MNEHHDPDASQADEQLDPRALDALRVALVSVPAPAGAVRDAHIEAALAAFDSAASNVHEPIVDMRATRRRRSRTPQLLAAAALVVVAGIGVALAVRTSSEPSDNVADSAPASQKTADQSSAAAERDGGSDGTSDRFADDAADSAAGMAPSAADGDRNTTMDNGYAAETGPTTAASAQQRTIEAPDLGEFTTDTALRDAVESLVADTSVASTTAVPPGVSPTAPPDPAAGQTESAPPTAPPTAPSITGPAAVLDTCAGVLPPSFDVVATATVAGAPVVVITLPSSDGLTSSRAVLDGSDCSLRPL